MVVNLCLPHFKTTIQCDKLCADGYDVTNLLSADPTVRRRGFKLEYFLRPPVQVTLQFGFQVEVCRVDVELWPWGMDRGQACKRLEISTSQEKSQQWAQRGQIQSHTDTSQGDFRLVGRCELREETHVSFSHPCFRPRPPFPSLPPPPREGCRQEELWSRGPLSLGSVKQLRVSVPYGAGASAMGLKALAVWGLPSRCCPPEEAERVRIAHENASLRPAPQLSHLASAQSPPVVQPQPLLLQVPEDFLDPLTQEVMLLPMLLPSGVSVDSSTLEEYQRREATWGRVPNDPFTGVPFIPEAQALPNPHLKSRIDRFLLQTGLEVREGMVGRQVQGESPHTSRLIPPERTGDSGDSAVTTSCCVIPFVPATVPSGSSHEHCSSASLDHEQRLSASLDQALLSALQGRPSFTSYTSQTPQVQHKHTDTPADTPTGRTFPISLLPPLLSPLPFLSLPGENRCGSCSCSLSVYSTSPSAYRLPCGHFLCRPCLHRKSRPLVTTAMPNHILCPTCNIPASSSNITRVHH
uniref:U-box domain containing 5 n=1 Tax=Oncorhynchus mykiss TaxID=8022 RepID=A0A8C7SID8_ONCMY